MKKIVVRKPLISTMGMPHDLAVFLSPVKRCLELVTGAIGGELKGLKKGASQEEVVEKINEIIARLNASGEAK